jgi:multimeric flavodoxin WrbA
MKVILVNGSPHEKGSTNAALTEIAETLGKEGIGSDIFWLGTKPISGCIACGACKNTGKCAIPDKVNDFLAIAGNYDGFVFGSPVHYAAASGAITSFMDRAFYAGSGITPKPFYLKPGAAIVVARRAGTTAALDQLHKYFFLAEMPIVTSVYWNMVHGAKADDIKQDLEGMQVMRGIGRNMAWLLKCKEAGIAAGVPFPEKEPRAFTNFIR